VKTLNRDPPGRGSRPRQRHQPGQAVCSWSAGYGQGTRLASLPVQVREAPVLILGAATPPPGVFPGNWDAAEQQV
jgi:hypothetical protein